MKNFFVTLVTVLSYKKLREFTLCACQNGFFRDTDIQELTMSFLFFSDRTLIVWKLTRDETNYGIPQKRLHGHSHFISDVVLSSDGNYALSGSWDKTLRLWDLAAGRTTRRFEDHTKVRQHVHLRLKFLSFTSKFNRMRQKFV